MNRRDRHNLPCFDREECGGKSSCSLFYKNKENNTEIPHLHCFRCEKQKWNLTEEEIELYTLMDANLLKLIDPNTDHKGNNLKLDREGLFPLRGIINAMEDRGISKAVAEKYGIETLFDQENKAYGYSFPSYNKDGDFIAQKVKRFDKRMKWLYKESLDNTLMFGQNLFPSGSKFLTITEGEEDALACYQMLKESAPAFEPAVISLSNGAASAEKECKKHWEYINSFENIILSFDGDEQGRKAAERICRLFNYKPKVMLFAECKKGTDDKYVWKDSNDYLKGFRAKDFVSLWWKAERVTPKGVITFSALWDAMTKKDNDLIATFPWDGLNKKLYGMYEGRLIFIKAPPKIGKTQILREILYHVQQTTKHNSGAIFLEDTKKSIGMGMCALHMNKPIHFPDVPVNLEELQKAHLEMSEGDRLMIFDPEDSRTVENIIHKITYFVKAHNCKVIVLDHISMLAYQADAGDERRFLDKLVADLKNLTVSLNICIIAVTHVNDDGKTRGSRAAVQLCDALINLERDKLADDPTIANTTHVIVEENRLTGDSGLACSLFFDRDTGRLVEVDPNLTMAVDGRQVQFDE